MLLLYRQKKYLHFRGQSHRQNPEMDRLFCACAVWVTATDCHERRRRESSGKEICRVCVARCPEIMFRAAVRLSVSGVRSLTSTQPGSRGIS